MLVFQQLKTIFLVFQILFKFLVFLVDAFVAALPVALLIFVGFQSFLIRLSRPLA